MQMLPQQRQDKAQDSAPLTASWAGTPQTTENPARASPSCAQRAETRNGLCVCKDREQRTNENTQQKPCAHNAWNCRRLASPRERPAPGWCEHWPCGRHRGPRTLRVSPKASSPSIPKPRSPQPVKKETQHGLRPWAPAPGPRLSTRPPVLLLASMPGPSLRDLGHPGGPGTISLGILD